MKKYMIYEYEKMPVCAFGPWAIDEVSEFLNLPKEASYPRKNKTLYQGKYLVVKEEEPRQRNRYMEAMAIACQELAHFTGETNEHAMKRILARVMLEPKDYERWLKQNG